MRAKERRRHHNELAEGGAEAQKLRQMKDDAFLRCTVAGPVAAWS